MQWRQSIDAEVNYEKIAAIEAYWARVSWLKKGCFGYLLAFQGYEN